MLKYNCKIIDNCKLNQQVNYGNVSCVEGGKMGIVNNLVKQSGNPSGMIGRIMVNIMNHIDSGLNQWIAKKINNPSSTVLDIGCGGGNTVYRLLRDNNVKHMIGIDNSLDSVAVAKKKNSMFIKRGRAEIIQGNVTDLPFQKYQFDIILTVRSHYFWSDFEKAFAEIYRTLKKDGKMYIFSEIFKIQYHLNKYNTDESMENFLQGIGFKNIQIENRTAIQCITAEK